MSVGKVDAITVQKATALGIKISGGSISKKDGRVRLFVKGRFPGAHKSGYALRSRVVWWLRTGEVVSGGNVDIHHENEDRADDRFGNLEKLDHVDHSRLHNPKTVVMVERACLQCAGTFALEKWRLTDPSRGRFCSQDCYQRYPKSAISRQRQSESLKQKYASGWSPR